MTATCDTHMFREAAEAPDAVRVQIESNLELMSELGEMLRSLAPRAVVTFARGSSDNAATFARYLIETRTGVLTSSAALSVSSVYTARRDLSGVVVLAISQSGASPDLLASVRTAREAGARVIALVNVTGSPLAQLAHHVVPLRAGSERSVAATKSFITSLAAIAHLVAAWTNDDPLLAGLLGAPEQLAAAWALDWSEVAERLRDVQDLYVIGRGLGLCVAQEAALKLKETCGMHAESFSAAEVRHGPVALVRPGFPVLLFRQSDETRSGIEALAAELAGQGADVTIAGPSSSAGGITSGNDARVLELPAVSSHPAIEPMLLIQAFYRVANALALARGCDPDHPPRLRKVTETV